MKRCPECRRDYYDDTLVYCLDDGARLARRPRDCRRTSDRDLVRTRSDMTETIQHEGRVDLKRSSLRNRIFAALQRRSRSRSRRKT